MTASTPLTGFPGWFPFVASGCQRITNKTSRHSIRTLKNILHLFNDVFIICDTTSFRGPTLGLENWGSEITEVYTDAAKAER